MEVNILVLQVELDALAVQLGRLHMNIQLWEDDLKSHCMNTGITNITITIIKLERCIHVLYNIKVPSIARDMLILIFQKLKLKVCQPWQS
mmetsp:Transcript_13936/g.16032  ORF Transcript_13936/g.16032 Transcript_13936/m.16032 type:complete len:90 (+) Transcript_13936:464-733(+)